MKVKRIAIGLILLICITSLSSCAPKGYESHEAGFFSGIWHGCIIVCSLIGRLFGADIGIYAEHNTGFFYWLGFIIATGVAVGSFAIKLYIIIKLFDGCKP
jgi:4-hydroxybenzoate polyprenyltransferase